MQEYVKGRSLLELIQEKQKKNERFSEEDMLCYLGECAEIIRTLQTCYMPPIIHRDIKPSNILIRDEKKDGYSVCLIDFGAVANPQRRNLNSTVAGTVGYMPPEQLIGDCAIQSDYYALGATGLHMLTNIAPSDFPSDGFKLLYEDKLKSVLPNIRADILELFRRLLAPQIADRPHDAEELDNLFQNAINSSRSALSFHKKIEETSSAQLTILILLSLVFFAMCYLSFYNKFFVFIGTFLIIMLLLLLTMTSKKIERLKEKIKALEKNPQNLAAVTKQESPKPSEKSSKNYNTTTATVAAIFADAIEFYFEADGKVVTYIYEYSNNGHYHIGDRIDIEYTKMYAQYQCKIVS